MGAEELALLGRLDETLRRRLAAYGQGPDRFGLVHADIRLANLLVDGEHVRVIDFDDCGWSWFMYDFATTEWSRRPMPSPTAAATASARCARTSWASATSCSSTGSPARCPTPTRTT